ncbi:hypothetical protein NDN08_001941 [Rhodosorus marinus]|uniref:Uncharacterized protein n=1 Tax=Rhodosorus marinus TaxID=101924 RepID=A0AAV8US90_9RHOD|nr:hypothetical protein NDN08_001941 [Rhodosorus marinus]
MTLSGSVAYTVPPTVVAITGELQDHLQVNDLETLEMVQYLKVTDLPVKLYQIVALENWLFVTAVFRGIQSALIQYEVQSTSNLLEFKEYDTFSTLCDQPLSLKATYDYIQSPILGMVCTESVLVVDPVILELLHIFPLPAILGIDVESAVDTALTANYIYITFATKPQGDEEKSEGLLVMYSRATWEMVRWVSVRGKTSHLHIAGSTSLFLTSSGNGGSYMKQLNPMDLKEAYEVNPQGFEFLRMAWTPDLTKLFMYIQKSGLNAGRVRNFDNTVYPVEKLCPDVRIEMSPGSQPVVNNEYLIVRSNASLTRFTLNDSGCPRQKTQTSYSLDPAVYSGAAILCLECLAIA